MEFLEKNYAWLETRISEIKDHYLIFDLPGQIELYTNHYSLKNIIQKMTRDGRCTLTAVHIVGNSFNIH